MTKKGTKKAATRRPSLKDRARAIIADERGHDEDTRDAVKHALEENHDDLAEIDRRAEAGEIGLDLTARPPTGAHGGEERARLLADILAPHELYQMPAELRAAALVELVGSLADEPDADARWLIAQAASTVAYTNTEEFGRSLEAFVSRMKAGAFDLLLAEELRAGRARRRGVSRQPERSKRRGHS